MESCDFYIHAIHIEMTDKCPITPEGEWDQPLQHDKTTYVDNLTAERTTCQVNTPTTTCYFVFLY